MAPKLNGTRRSPTLATPAEIRAGVACRRFGRVFGSSRIDDAHAINIGQRAAKALYNISETHDARRAMYFRAFDAKSRGIEPTDPSDDSSSSLFRDVLDPSTDVPIPKCRDMQALSADTIVYITNIASQSELLRFIPSSSTLHDSIVESCFNNRAHHILDCGSVGLANDLAKIMTGDVAGTTLGSGPFMYSWMAAGPDRTAQLTTLDTLLKDFRTQGFGHMPDVGPLIFRHANILAPWTAVTHFFTGAVSRSYAILYLMTSLVLAWCPHNFSAVGWMFSPHTMDPLGNQTPATQCRSLALLFFLRFQANSMVYFLGVDQDIVLSIIDSINIIHTTMLDVMPMHLDPLYMLARSPIAVGASLIAPVEDLITELAAPTTRTRVPATTLFDEIDDDEFDTIDIPITKTKPTILWKSPILFPTPSTPPFVPESPNPFRLPGEDDYPLFNCLSPIFRLD